ATATRFRSERRHAHSCTIRCARWSDRWCWSATTSGALTISVPRRPHGTARPAGRSRRPKDFISSAWTIEMISRRALLSLPLFAATAARAQNYPSGQVRIVVPFPPGGATDVLGRVLAAGLQTLWAAT